MPEPLKLDRFHKRLEALRTERQSWLPHWRELAEYVLPHRGRFEATDRNKGDKRHGSIIDNTGLMARRTLAAGMMSGITSPARPWFRLATPDPALMEDGASKMWLGDVEARMREVFNRSNLYNALHQVYEELAAFGPAVMIVHEDYENVIRCQTLTAGEYMFALSHRFQANTLYREMSMTVGQLVEQFGRDALTNTTRDLYDRGCTDTWVDVVNAIEPNDQRVAGMADAANKPWRSVWWEKGARESKFLRISGYDEFPAMCPRWHAMGSDVYGRSPAMDALGDIKQLQFQEKKKAKALDLMVDPPWNVPSSLKSVNALPGGINFYDPTANSPGVTPLHTVNPRTHEMQVDMDRVRQRIRDAFFADLFLMIAEADGQMTATEVRIRQEEKLLMLGPVLERLHHELLNPLIDRTFAIMLRAGLIPEPPPALQGVELKVEYISMLAQAQKATAISGLERLAGYVGNLAAVNQDVLDKLDFDQVVDTYGEALGVPARVLRPDEKVAAIRHNRAQQEQAMQRAALLQQAAEGAKTLSEARTDDGNLPSQVTGGLV